MKIDAVLILTVRYDYSGDVIKEAKREIRASLANMVGRAVSNGLLSGSEENVEVETWSDQSFIEVSNEE